MKSKKIIISALVMLIIICINSHSDAKYVFEQTQKAVEIRIISK